MRITLTRTVASPGCAGRPNQTVECEDTLARILIDAGAARPAGEDGASRPSAEPAASGAEPNPFAESSDAAGEDAAPEATTSPYTTDDLMAKTRADLLELASDLGVATTSTMTKPTIVAAIIDATA